LAIYVVKVVTVVLSHLLNLIHCLTSMVLPELTFYGCFVLIILNVTEIRKIHLCETCRRTIED